MAKVKQGVVKKDRLLEPDRVKCIQILLSDVLVLLGARLRWLCQSGFRRRAHEGDLLTRNTHTMKSIQKFKNLFRKTLLGAVLALLTAGTARATWFEVPVGGIGEGIYGDSAASDPAWNVYWCKGANNLYAVWWNGSAWTGTPLATNCASFANHNIACDPVNHWVFYSGNDGYIWVVYWTGSAWATNKVGSNINYGRQLCVDNVFHGLWYLDSANRHLWILYWNGSTWIETKIDGTSQRFDGNRSCGVDSTWHVAWYVTADRKSVRGTYWNGSSWVNGAPLTPLAGTDLYYSICAQEETHTVFNWQTDAGFNNKQGGYHYWNGSAWTPGICFPNGNTVPNSGAFCVWTPNPLSCFIGGFQNCHFTTFAPYARNWATCRQDTSGLQPLCVGLNGRLVLCRIVGTLLPRLLYSDLP
jgi:hypothetical protein